MSFSVELRQAWGEHKVKGRSYYLCSYPIHDLHSPTTYLYLPEKDNKLCLFCRLNFLNFSSSDKLVSRRKCKHKKEILYFYPNLFISLIFVWGSCSIEVKQEEESGSTAKKPGFDPIEEPGTSGVSSASKTRKFKGKEKRKIRF